MSGFNSGSQLGSTTWLRRLAAKSRRYAEIFCLNIVASMVLEEYSGKMFSTSRRLDLRPSAIEIPQSDGWQQLVIWLQAAFSGVLAFETLLLVYNIL